MAAKKSDNKDSVTVKVTVPASKGVPILEIEKTAALAARDSIPANIPTSACRYELVDSKKSGDDRTYDVKVSWGADVVSPDLDVTDDDEDRVRAIISPASDPLA